VYCGTYVSRGPLICLHVIVFDLRFDNDDDVSLGDVRDIANADTDMHIGAVNTIRSNWTPINSFGRRVEFIATEADGLCGQSG
jgi:hypothetical protein